MGSMAILTGCFFIRESNVNNYEKTFVLMANISMPLLMIGQVQDEKQKLVLEVTNKLKEVTQLFKKNDEIDGPSRESNVEHGAEYDVKYLYTVLLAAVNLGIRFLKELNKGIGSRPQEDLQKALQLLNDGSMFDDIERYQGMLTVADIECGKDLQKIKDALSTASNQLRQEINSFKEKVNALPTTTVVTDISIYKGANPYEKTGDEKLRCSIL